MASGHCHAISFWGRIALRGMDVKAPKADVAPFARAQVVRQNKLPGMNGTKLRPISGEFS